MKNFKFTKLMLLLAMGLATVVFTSCGNGNEPTVDNGVVINGVKWATRNVDKPGTFAAKPEDTGMLYQWNRNVGWSSTDFINSNGTTKWNEVVPLGDTWETANNICPKGWRVPTLLELQSLLNSENKWTATNGVNGRVFGTGKNTVFLPAAGLRASNDGERGGSGDSGYYWSSLAYEYGNEQAYSLFFDNNDEYIDGGYRRYGYCVRCVAE
ncbi:MAG: DUF1566 domain-containing protein [Prevotellaceae bacterium]|jgi:uncharacterized protein (TIGR02145 family)|nr:DUF1566 domain-containing protein [Prevotellaceae bacterium]